MSKQVYISADYSENDGDREVVKELNKWGQDNLHKVVLLICLKWHLEVYQKILIVEYVI